METGITLAPPPNPAESGRALGLIPATAQVRLVAALVALIPLAIALLVATKL